MENFLVCDCCSLEHILKIWYDKNCFPELYFEVHLITYHNLLKKLSYGLKYAFGYKSRFGSWDEFIFDKENEKKLYFF